MRLKSAVPRFVGVILFVNAVAGPVLAADEPDPRKRAWEIFERARERAGAGPSAEPVRDYTFDLVTRIPNPKEKDKQIELTSKGFFLTPNLVRQEIEAPGAKVIVVFDGQKGWQMLPNNTRYLPDKASTQIQADLARSHVFLAELPARDQVRFLGEEEVGGRMTEVIELNDVGNMPQTSPRLFLSAAGRFTAAFCRQGNGRRGQEDVRRRHAHGIGSGGGTFLGFSRGRRIPLAFRQASCA